MTKIYLDELRLMLKNINELSSNKIITSNNKNKNTLKKIKVSLKKIKITDVKYNNKYLNDSFRSKYGLQFPFCKLQIETQTRLQKIDKTVLKNNKLISNNTRRNTVPTRRKNSAHPGKKVGFTVDETFKRIIIRTDLNINRNIKLLHQIESASRAHTSIPNAGRFNQQFSDMSSNPSSRRSSWLQSVSNMYGTDTEDSLLDNSRVLKNRFPRITEFNKDPQRLMNEIGLGNERLSTFSISGLIAATNTTEINEENEISYILDDIQNEEKFQNLMKRMSTMDDCLQNEFMLMLEDASILGINNYSARQLWIVSCLKTNKFMVKYTDLYPNLIELFRKCTQLQNVPTQIDLQSFFVEFTENKYNKNEQENTEMELIIRSKDFDRFYIWFKSMCDIISDCKHIYNNNNIDNYIPLESLFYTTNKSEEILLNVQYKIGTFLLRLSNKANEIVISFKTKDNKIKHIPLIRCEQNIYQIGKSPKQLPIFTFIKSLNVLKYLFIKHNVTIHKDLQYTNISQSKVTKQFEEPNEEVKSENEELNDLSTTALIAEILEIDQKRQSTDSDMLVHQPLIQEILQNENEYRKYIKSEAGGDHSNTNANNSQNNHQKQQNKNNSVHSSNNNTNDSNNQSNQNNSNNNSDDDNKDEKPKNNVNTDIEEEYNIDKILQKVEKLKQHGKYKIMVEQKDPLSESELVALVYYTDSNSCCHKMKQAHRRMILANADKWKMLYYHATNA
eukprot:296972_1